MKESIRDILKDESGMAVVWLLVFLPLLMAAVTGAVRATQAVTAADADLSGALKSAAKAAAMQVTPGSQAAGDPRIDAARANAAFCRELARTLGLDEVSLSPLAGSMLDRAPDYVLVVYNGDDKYAGGGAPGGKKYVFSGGTLSEYDVAPAGFPYLFGVTASDVLPGAPGDFQVELETPGVVAVARTTARRIAGRDALDPVRWAAARIIKR